ncbi:MAG: hypothetical protein QY322_00530 [bacterium]|nr:MAG: hypothetical protein QY322_00530 [bacterium]
MDKKQKTTKEKLVVLPRVSIFDKRARNQFNPTSDRGQSMHGQTKANSPQFRINQHKGA